MVAALVGATLCQFGCSSGGPPSFVGKWTCKAGAQGSNSSFTFNADGTMSFVATNGPKQVPYKETGMGTWSASAKALSVTPVTVQLDCPSKADRAKLLPYVNAQVNVKSTSPFVWKGNDEFLLSQSGVQQDFKRSN